MAKVWPVVQMSKSPNDAIPRRRFFLFDQGTRVRNICHHHQNAAHTLTG